MNGKVNPSKHFDAIMKNTLLFASFAVLSQGVNAWVRGPYLRQSFLYCSLRSISSKVALEALPAGYQDIGTQIIQEVGTSCGMKSLEDLDIEWKVGRVVVTVRGKVYVSNPDETGESEDDEVEEDDKELPPETVSGIDITQLARAINFALGETEIGNAIAEAHEIEVTTPGASGKQFFLGFKKEPLNKSLTLFLHQMSSRGSCSRHIGGLT